MPAVRACSDQRDKSIQEQSGCSARPGCWQLQALWSEIHHLQQAACLDAFVWGQEIGEVIAPSWCSSSLLRLLAGKMKATPIISENTPNELSWASGVQARATTPSTISSLNLYTLSMHDGTKDIVNFSFLYPCLSGRNETLLEIVCQCNWGHVQKHRSPFSQFSNRSSNNMVFSVKGKEKWMSGPSKRTSFAPPPLLSTPWLWAKAIFFFFFPHSFKRWNRRCWMMDRCAGIVLFCSALKEIIDLHYSPTHKTQPLRTHARAHTHTHTRPHPHLTVPPLWLHHLPHGSPHPRLLIKEWMFISLPVFYRGGVLSPASGSTSPGLTSEGKAITPWNRLLQDDVKTIHYLIENIHLDALKWGLLRET